jgi:hypothetical protein
MCFSGEAGGADVGHRDLNGSQAAIGAVSLVDRFRRCRALEGREPRKGIGQTLGILDGFVLHEAVNMSRRGGGLR